MKNMRGEIPPAEWEKNKTFVEHWPPIRFCLCVGGAALALAGLLWWL